MDRLEAQLLPPRQLALATAGVMLAMFLSVFSQAIVATAMPRIIADLGGFGRYTWPATAYLVATAVAAPIVGRLSDIHGRRVFLIAGLVIFTLCSIPAGLFPPQGRGRFEAYAGLASGIAAVTGPLLGGFITDHFGWCWIFLLNVPVGLAVLAIVPAFPKARSEVEDRRPDCPGMTTLALAVASVMVGLSWGNDGGAAATGLVAFGVAMAAAFVIVESKSAHPIIPFEVYRNRAVAVSLVVVLLSGFGVYASLLFTPLFFQVTLGMSATGSGSVLAPIVAGLVIGRVLSGQVVARTGGYYRAQAVAGTGILATGMYLLSAMNEATSLTWGMACVFVAGIGAGGTLSTFRLAVQNAVPFRLVGAATAALQFCRLLSGTVGLAVLGVVLTRSLSARLDETLSESVKAASPPGRLEAIKNDPQALVDPVAADNLTAGLKDLGPDGAGMGEALLGSLNAALAGAVGDVFILSTGLVVLSRIVAIFLRGPCHAAVQAHGPDEEGHHAA